MANVVRQTWSEIPGWGKFAIIGGTLFFGGRFANQQIKAAKERARLRKMKQTYEKGKKDTAVVDQSGNMQPITLNTATAATIIHDAIYNNDPMGWTEDETRIVKTLQTVPKGFIVDVENDYYELFNKNLREDVTKALDDDEWEKVQHLFQ